MEKDPKNLEDFYRRFNETHGRKRQLATESLMVLQKAHDLFIDKGWCIGNEVSRDEF